MEIRETLLMVMSNGSLAKSLLLVLIHLSSACVDILLTEK